MLSAAVTVVFDIKHLEEGSVREPLGVAEAGVDVGVVGKQVGGIVEMETSRVVLGGASVDAQAELKARRS